MTTNNVVSDQHSVVIQNQTTGQVDFLRFNGSSLQSSALRDYGIGGWTVVANGDFGGPAGAADGFPDLVVQNQATGQLDFLWLNASANLIGSALGPVVPHVVGSGFFGGPTFTIPAGQVGNTIVSQLSNGQLDFLGFNGKGALIASDLVANTLGLPAAVGVGESDTNWPVFANNGAQGNDNVLVQDATGNLIAIGFSGGTASGGLTYTNSFLRGPINDTFFAVDQDNNVGSRDANIFSTVDGTLRETFDAVGVDPTNGRVDIHSWVSGYGDPSHEGNSLGVIHTNLFLSAGWQVVDAGIVDHSAGLLPLA